MIGILPILSEVLVRLLLRHFCFRILLPVDNLRSNSLMRPCRHRIRFCTPPLFPKFPIKSLPKKVANQLVSRTGKMDFVTLCKSGLLPFLHRPEPAHDFKLVPYGTTSKVCQTIAHIADLQPIAVDRITAPPGFAITVVIGNKYERTTGIDSTDGIAETEIVVLKRHRIETIAVGIINTDTENDQIGTYQFEVAGQRTFKKVGDRSPIDTDRIIYDSGIAAAQIDSCECEYLPGRTRDYDVERINRRGEIEYKTMVDTIDIGGVEFLVAMADSGDNAMWRPPQNDNPRSGVVKTAVVIDYLDTRRNILCRDRNATKPHRIFGTAMDIPRENHLLNTMDLIVGGVIATGCCRIWEYHPASPDGLWVGRIDMGADAMRQRAGLHMRSSHMHNI